MRAIWIFSLGMALSNLAAAAPLEDPFKVLQSSEDAFHRGDFSAAEHLSHRARQLFHARGDLENESTTLRMLARQKQIHGGHQEALKTIEKAIKVSRPLKDRRALALNLVWSGWILGEMGRCGSALLVLEQAVQLSRQLNYDMGIGFGMQEMGSCYRRVGRDEDASRRLEESIAIARRINVPSGIMEGNTILAEVRLHQGRYVDARQLLEEAYSVATKVGSEVARSYTAEALGRVELNALRKNEAKHWFEVALDSAQKSHFERGLAGTLVGLAQLTEDGEHASEMLEQALDIYGRIADENEGWAMARIGIHLTNEGKPKEAAFVLDQALDLVREVFQQEQAGIVLGEQGKLATRDGDAIRAIEKRKEAVAAFRADHNDVQLWQALDALSVEHERAGDLGRALSVEREALNVFKRLPQVDASLPALREVRRQQEILLAKRIGGLILLAGHEVPQK